MKKEKTKLNIFTVIFDILKIYLKNNKFHFIFTVLLSISVGLTAVANTWIKQIFFDAVSDAILGEKEYKVVLFIGLVLILFMVVNLLVSTFSDLLTGNIKLKLQGHLWFNINEKASKIEAINYEDAEKLDSINKSFMGAEGATEIFASVLKTATYYIPYLLFMAIYLYNIQPILCICIAVAFLPNFINNYIRYKNYVKLEDIQAPLRRKSEYYQRCIADREFYKETRMLGAFDYFKKLFDNALDTLNEVELKLNVKINLIGMKIRLVSILGSVIIFTILLYTLIKGDITVGTFAAIFSSIGTVFDVTNSSFENISGMSDNLGKVYNYYKFMDFPEKEAQEVEISGYDLQLKNVSFRYPNANKNSLTDINLHINPGETLAIVGENGSGKTTLVKLLMGIYMPSSGEILIDGHNTKNVTSKALHKGISAVFQKYQRYKMTLKQNIEISALDGSYNDNKLSETIKKADFDVQNRSFVDGENTLLAKEFGGVDLSGGQWQKVAIARGLYRNHQMIILDEPTAAIDPIEETKIYNKFAEISKGKTTIIVTHRLGSAKIADKIVVLDSGQLIEYGTHEALLNSKGKYFEMYESQAQWYERA
jgi:ATP-binding cassette subfamily B protein